MSDSGLLEAPAEEPQTENSAEASRIMFIFSGFNGLLESFQLQNVSPDQLLYLAQWLDWYSKRVKDHAEMRKAQATAQVLRPGQPAMSGDLRPFN